MDAFRNSKEQNIDIFELDVILSKDKKVVVIHDNNLVRLCDKNVHVTDLNYDQMPGFQAETLIEFTPLWHQKTKLCKTPYFPLLKDLFKEFPN